MTSPMLSRPPMAQRISTSSSLPSLSSNPGNAARSTMSRTSTGDSTISSASRSYEDLSVFSATLKPNVTAWKAELQGNWKLGGDWHGFAPFRREDKSDAPCTPRTKARAFLGIGLTVPDVVARARRVKAWMNRSRGSLRIGRRANAKDVLEVEVPAELACPFTLDEVKFATSLSDSNCSTYANPPSPPPPSVEGGSTYTDLTAESSVSLPLMFVPLLPLHALVTGLVILLAPSLLTSFPIPLLPTPGPRRLAYWCDALHAHVGIAVVALASFCYALGKACGSIELGVTLASVIAARIFWVWRWGQPSRVTTDAEGPLLGEDDWESVVFVMNGATWGCGEFARVRIRGEVQRIYFHDCEEKDEKEADVAGETVAEKDST